MNSELASGGKCRACSAPVEPDWASCAACGTPLSDPQAPGRGPPDAATGRDDRAVQMEHASPVGGAKRPVTTADPAKGPAGTGAVPLTGVFIHRRYEDRTPAQPHTPDPRRPVTIILPKPARPEGQRVDDVGQASAAQLEAPASEVEPDLHVDLEPAVELKTPAGGDAPREREPVDAPVPASRLAAEDLAEIRRIVDAAVATALEQLAANAAAAQSASPATGLPGPLARLGQTGTGGALVAAGTLGGLVALYWDTWVAGVSMASIGWLQLSGIVGAAALAGAGAAVLAFAVARRRRAPAPTPAPGAAARSKRK